jgi:hypothetical protein
LISAARSLPEKPFFLFLSFGALSELVFSGAMSRWP